MDKFVRVISILAVILSVVTGVVLIGIGVLLLFWPDIFLKVLRVGLALAAIVAGIYVLLRVIVIFLKLASERGEE